MVRRQNAKEFIIFIQVKILEKAMTKPSVKQKTLFTRKNQREDTICKSELIIFTV
jgi:hypothetical protein